MAITKIHAVKTSVQKAVDYICDPDKTEGRILISSFGCDPHTAGEEFRYILSHGTGRGNNKAFHVIQSFAPGEVSPEEAHKIGEELAGKLLGGNYSYVLSTHVNTDSVHNHLIFCAVDNFEHKKYYDNKRSYKYLRSLSDRICEEHGLSIIADPSYRKGLSYTEWIASKNDRSWKIQLRNDIRACIKASDSYEEFIGKMKGLGYDIKGEALQTVEGKSERSVPKYISFRAPGYDRFVRGSLRTLGKGFSKEEIAAEIIRQKAVREAKAPVPVKSIYDYKPRADISRRTEPFTRLIDTSDSKYLENPGLMKWADKKNLQAVAHAYAEAGSLSELDKKIEESEKAAGDIDNELLKCEKTITELKELSVFVQNYQKYKKYDDHYRQAKDPEKYYESHESQLMIFDAARRHIREKGLDPEQVSYRQVMEGIQRMQEKSDGLKEKYRALREEVRDMEKQRELITEYLGKERKMEHQAPTKKVKQHVL